MSKVHRAPVLALCLLTASSALVTCGGSGEETSTRSTPPDDQAASRPNVVVIMTDDQGPGLMQYMPKTRRLLAQKGVTFQNNVVSYPLCCPSRATFLTGQYAHNHRVLSDRLPTGGFQKLDSSNTLPMWLQLSGYHTAYVGKYLNGFPGPGEPPNTPPGWDDFAALTRHITDMYHYSLVRNGKVTSYGSGKGSYKTFVLSELALDSLDNVLDEGKRFFLTFAPTAPHLERSRVKCPNPRPPPGMGNRLEGPRPPRPRSFDESDPSDKPRFLRDLPPFDAETREVIDCRRKSRALSLAPVDDFVGRLTQRLETAGELERTLILFTSDNGFMDGAHRIPSGKVVPYEQDIRVPLILRGPGLPSGVKREQLVGNVDLAATILDAADGSPGLTPDGVSLLPVARNPRPEHDERSILLEAEGADEFPGQPAPPYRGVRTKRWSYIEYSNGQRELYDLTADPGQLRNLASSSRSKKVVGRLAPIVRRLQDCAGDKCR